MKHWDIITSGDAHVVTIVCDGMCPTSPDPLLCNVAFLTSTAHCQPEQLLGSALVSHHVTMQKKSSDQELGTGQLYTFNIAWMGLQGKSSNIF